MRFSVLSSGSKANCTFFESGSTRILIDCGLSARETERRLRQLAIDPASLDAIIVTHEHSDHIVGIPRLSARYEIPVYASRETGRHIPGVKKVQSFDTGGIFSIDTLEIHPVSIMHDAIDPVGFVIKAEGLTFAHMTDLGHVTALVREAIKNCNALVLESNHDLDMLWGCQYPWDLKQRIASRRGHLSNEAAGELLADIQHPELIQLVLAHISENSNTPELVLSSAKKYIESSNFYDLLCGSRYAPTPLIEVGERVRYKKSIAI